MFGLATRRRVPAALSLGIAILSINEYQGLAAIDPAHFSARPDRGPASRHYRSRARFSSGGCQKLAAPAANTSAVVTGAAGQQNQRYQPTGRATGETNDAR
jgi:hypothetical protein